MFLLMFLEEVNKFFFFRSLISTLANVFLNKPCIHLKLCIAKFPRVFSIPADAQDEFKAMLLHFILLATKQSKVVRIKFPMIIFFYLLKEHRDAILGKLRDKFSGKDTLKKN